MQSRSLKKWSKSVLHVGVAALLVSTSAMADDTEVFTAQIASSAKPNILFVLDYSESMGDAAPGTSVAKINILKEAVRTLLNDNRERIAAGIGPMFGDQPGGVKWPTTPLDIDASIIDPSIPAGRVTPIDLILQFMDERPVQGSTALVDALAEAAAYFRGGNVYHNGRQARLIEWHRPARWNHVTNKYEQGHATASNSPTYLPRDAYLWSGGVGGVSACRDYTYGGVYSDAVNFCAGLELVPPCDYMKPWSSDGEGGRVSREHYRCYYKRPEQWRGATYESPIESQCQVNAVVLVSDGEPTYKGNRAQWDAVLDVDFWKCDDISHIFPNEPEKYAATCGIDIARQMATTDQVTGIDESFVRTYTVGFDTGDSTQTYLEEIARVGNGKFFNASTPQDLTAAFNEIVSNLLTTSQSFTPAAVDVDRADFAHDNRLFFAMFKPSASQSWIGNLKGYFLGPEGLTDIHGRTATTVQDGVRYMKPSAQSFWSGSADGDNVALGGASNRIPEFADRKIYTYLGSDPFDPEEGDIPAGGVRINDWNNAIDRWQSKLTDEKLDDPDDRDALLRWIKSAPMGDPLHSQPVQIDYGYRKMIYIMTNQGFLHAIRADKPEDIPAEGTTGDSSGGREMFAWMPAELLPNIKKHYAPEQSFDHIYGLDGDLVPWHVDKNEDGLVNGEDSLQLVMGMRRGGKHYYSLDVRDPWVVRLKWRIDGDSDSFPNLGETWSRPSLVTVNKGGVPTEVLVFGGGYDQDELDGTTSREESAGNAIYMADKNGNKIWSVDESDHPRMKYAIPSDLSVIDTDADGIVDRIYVGDLGGQVWRVDISDINSTPDVNVLADLNDGGHRTFFYPPSVSLHTGGNEDYLAVAIGSGNRTNPLREDSNDRIYMIKDTHIKEKMAASEPIITVNELYDATDNDIGDLDKSVSGQAKEELNNSNGWYINLGDSEKSLTQLVTYDGQLLATTFDAEGALVDDDDINKYCTPTGSNNFYRMDVATAQPVPPPGGDAGNIRYYAEDRSSPVNGDGILPAPQVLIPKTGDANILVDNEIVGSFPTKASRIYWHAK